MSEKKELSIEELKNVSGGDNGDSAKEGAFWSFQVNYRYKVGDVVEVYRSSIHSRTRQGIIQDRRPKENFDYSRSEYRYYGEYQIYYPEGPTSGHSQYEWVTADDIESS